MLDPQGEVGPGAAGGIEGLTEGWGPASARSLKASGFQKGRGLRQVWPKARGQWLRVCQDQGCKSPAGLSTGPSRALGLVTRRTPTPPGPSLPQGEAALRSGWRTRRPPRCVRQPARGASAPSRRAACSSCITLAETDVTVGCWEGRAGPGQRPSSDTCTWNRDALWALATVRKGEEKSTSKGTKMPRIQVKYKITSIKLKPSA